MSDYDFRTLHDKDFEILVIDLLTLHKNTLIERFRPGKDKGIDGRFYIDKKKIIIQAKHYSRSGLSGLMRSLKNEVSKVEVIRPSGYIVATSVPLTDFDKEKIMGLFKPFIISKSDIIGAEDLNTLLVKYPEVEEKHFKLWLSGTKILSRIQNHGVYGRSNSVLEDIYEKSKIFIKTSQFEKSLDILNKNNILLITGLPGVGKTTLANQLTLFFVSKGYEFIHITEDINEADRVYSKEIKQFFYFDDFLGANYLELLNGNTSSAISLFLRRITKSKHNKIILTSRTNILNRARSLSEILSHSTLNNHEYELNVTNLSLREKGEMLYNHLWHSGLDVTYLSQIYENKNYWKIIEHINFNPRVIEFITSDDRIHHIDPKNYWLYILNIMNNPKDIWEFYFKKQLSKEQLFISCLVAFNGGSITEHELKDAYYKLVEKTHPANSIIQQLDYNDYIKESLRSTINRTIHIDNNISISLFNPSISDYLIDRFHKDHDFLQLLYTSLLTIKSINFLFALFKESKVRQETLLLIINNIISSLNSNIMRKYDISLIHHLISNSPTFDNIAVEVLSKVNIEDLKLNEIEYNKKTGDIILFMAKKHLIDIHFAKDFICQMLSDEKGRIRHVNIVPLTYITQEFDFDDAFISWMKDKIYNYWECNADNEIQRLQIFQYMEEDEFDTANDIAGSKISELLSEYAIELGEYECDEIIGGCDITWLLPETSSSHDDEEITSPFLEKLYAESEHEYIEDLFQSNFEPISD